MNVTVDAVQRIRTMCEYESNCSHCGQRMVVRMDREGVPIYCVVCGSPHIQVKGFVKPAGE